jgi:hypothetical protein
MKFARAGNFAGEDQDVRRDTSQTTNEYQAQNKGRGHGHSTMLAHGRKSWPRLDAPQWPGAVSHPGTVRQFQFPE